MSPQFDWHAVDDDGRWEVIAQTTGRTRRRVPRWVWASLLVAVVSLGTVACVLARRYDEASQQIAFQIQGVVDVEARAFAEGDGDLLLSQQDGTFALLYRNRLRELGDRNGRAFLPPVTVLPAQVERVNVQGDVAWVQVIEGVPPVRRVRFYRQTDQGWQHTAPVLAYWQDFVIHEVGDQLVLYYHERDRPYVDPLIEELGQAFYRICATAGCDQEERFEVLFYPAPADVSVHADLAIPSPWLSGIPVEGAWSETHRAAILVALESRTAGWTRVGGASPFLRGRAFTTARWLDLASITPEMAQLGIPLSGRAGDPGRSDVFS
jgi:hypothetical protein